jgi:UDP-N-acetylmuramoylalanine--D-glutamate ligase
MASLRRLRVMGNRPVLVDDHPGAPTVDGLEVLALEDGGFTALQGCDVVVKSPGISRYRAEVAALEAAGIPVRGGLGLWLEDAPAERVACITGTKGKSTTTAIAGHLLAGLGYRVEVGGNIGRPPWEPPSDDDPEAGEEPDFWVIEVSSYQVPDVTSGPAVVAVTSLSPDHLDWHGSVERYYADKLSLCTKPRVQRVIAEGSNPVLRDHAAVLGPNVTWVDTAEPRFGGEWSDALGLRGEHNNRNAAVARAVLHALGVPEADDAIRLAEAAGGFTGLPSRCRSLGSIGGVEFVDDSLSTNVLPAQAALESFADRPVALLVGGHDRGLDYAPLGNTVAARVRPTLVVTLPANGPRIGKAVRSVVPGARDVQVVDAADMQEAVTLAHRWSDQQSGADAVVLLSPAAPSFGQFADYRARAEAFAAAAQRLGPLG